MAKDEITFWERRRDELELSQRAMATRLGVSNTTIVAWEDWQVVPQLPIQKLAEGYEAPADKIESELIVQRRAIEGRRASAAH